MNDSPSSKRGKREIWCDDDDRRDSRNILILFCNVIGAFSGKPITYASKKGRTKRFRFESHMTFSDIRSCAFLKRITERGDNALCQWQKDMNHD
jgi:hypothetical protein